MTFQEIINHGIRTATEEEVKLFSENGWVLLRSLLSPECVALLKTSLVSKVGANGLQTYHPARTSMAGWGFNTYGPVAIDNQTGASEEPYLHAFTHSRRIGYLGAQLMGSPVRYALDQSLIKVPDAKGNNDHVYWHQDGPGTPSSPFDFDAQIKFWIALAPISPDCGSMRFVHPSNVTHQVREVMCDRSAFPGSINKLESLGIVSPAISLEAGDVTVHRGSTWHSSLRNTTNSIRWAYAVSVFASSARYTGNPWWVVNGLRQLREGDLFPDFRFPIL